MLTKEDAMRFLLKSPINIEPTWTRKYILGICPYKTNFAELIFAASGQNSIPRKLKKNLKFSNDFIEYRKRSVA